ncbi:tRNA-dihydrouridine synthase family protein [Marinomonas hwangdonensis]|uniref:tRNA-dihydrouridine(16) synthase n=2 Tax=Marinomonas hwangdonensis TaxID=1053647 RepID=A0A3M8Q3D6_9GAMM|nr:tRNA-dihydrouridine synthase family protein [Marinomonas hwangdonensis]RNF50608.1 tRNA-dihydrouridine synthase family protein [Marinomonas hwangdonensis]
MEGVMDHTMRALLSKIGGMDYFVSEFVRVTQQPIPTSSFIRLVPEHQNQGRTEHKHPVHTQLLGSNAELMAESALHAVLAGATHIDVNFGCPAKRVNGHGGGSVLLETPQTLHDIMSGIRKKLPAHIPVSAKIRLGFNDEALLFDNVAAIEAAGTNTLTVHGRTKKDGYKPPARWEKIGSIQDKTGMTVVANGDIIDANTLLRCQSITGCRHFMIGRGALNNPFAFHQIRKQLNGEVSTSDATDFAELFAHYALALQNNYDDISALGRLKQWCGHLKFEFNPVNHHLYDLRRSQTVTELVNKFREIMTEKPL